MHPFIFCQQKSALLVRRCLYDSVKIAGTGADGRGHSVGSGGSTVLGEPGKPLLEDGPDFRSDLVDRLRCIDGEDAVWFRLD